MSPVALHFAIAIKPLAIALRSSDQVKDFRSGDLEEKVALYADDLLLFLGDTQDSLWKAMNIINRFGQISGLKINWPKSSLLPVDPLIVSLPEEVAQIPVVNTFKYLGINISKDLQQYTSDNIDPLLIKFRGKIKVWKRLPISVAGRCNLTKMIWMSQLLYVLHNLPICHLAI